MSNLKRVVITGIGCVTPAGLNVKETWETLAAGKDCSNTVTHFDTSVFDSHKGCEVKNFDSANYPILKDYQNPLLRGTQYSLVAAQESIKQSGITIKDQNKIPISFGLTLQENYVIEKICQLELEKKYDEINAELVDQNRCRYIPDQIKKMFGLNGEVTAISAACAAGNYAQANAFDAVRYGESPIAIAGSMSVLSIVAYAGFKRVGGMSPDICAPFSLGRKGLLIGDGAAILVFEDYEHAKTRGAKILAEVLGYGISCDAYHPTAPHPEGAGASRCMLQALEMAKVNSQDISYISAHGTGTAANDPAETKAMQKVFGDNLKNIPVSSIKSMIGHGFSAASAIETAMSCLMLEKSLVLPTIHFENPDPACPIDCVPNQTREKKLNLILNNAFGFGGNNCSVVLAGVN